MRWYKTDSKRVASADFERLTRGDFVIPLKSPKLKEVADPTTVFGRFLLNPTQENIEVGHNGSSLADVEIQQL